MPRKQACERRRHWQRRKSFLEYPGPGLYERDDAGSRQDATYDTAHPVRQIYPSSRGKIGLMLRLLLFW